MAKSNDGSRKSRSSNSTRSSSGGGGGGGTEAGSASAEHGEHARSQSRRNGASSRAASSSQSRGRSTKSNPDQMSAARRGFAEGEQRGRAAGSAIRSAGSGAVSGAMSSVRGHPVPAALIGAGLAWLLLENRGLRPLQPSTILERGRETLGGLGEVVSDAAETTRDALGNVTNVVGRSVGSAAEYVTEGAEAIGEYAQSGASTVAESVRDAASAVGDGVRDAARYVGEGASTGYEYTRETVSNLWENYPLAVAAALLGAGVAAGMMLPSTTRESRVLGQTARQARRQLRDKSGELLERGREIASSAARAIATEGERQGLAPDELGRKIKRLARSGRNAATAS